MEGIALVLKRNEQELAVAEAKAAMYGWGFWTCSARPDEGVILFTGKRKVPSGLGLSRRALRVLFTCPIPELSARLAEFGWTRFFRGRSYRVTVTKQVSSPIRSVALADIIWNAQQGPKVDLENPDVRVEIILTRQRAYVGSVIWEGKEDFVSRKANTWPAPHPSAMHPASARALVNLACAKRIHDPFCGAGGLIIEAGLAGVRASGGDIDPQMISRAKRNTSRFKLRPQLRIVDATEWLPRVPAIVTDLPYGKNTKNVNFKHLMDAFLEKAKSHTSRLIIGLPEKMKKSKGWEIRGHFTSYVHRSITRHLYVLDRSSTKS